MTTVSALNRIANDLERVAKAADALHPIDPFEITTAVARIRAQAEIIDKKLED